MPAVARKDDEATTGHACDTVTTVVDPTGDSVKVYANDIAVECKGDPTAPHTILSGLICVAHPSQIMAGSSTVFVGGKSIARVGDLTDIAGQITSGSPNVFAG